MAKKTDAGAAADGPKKMMPADCFSAFMALSGLTTVTKAQLELMSHLDGVRTADSYQHSFRSVVAKAKELKKRIDEGEKFEPVAPGGKKSGGMYLFSSTQQRGSFVRDAEGSCSIVRCR